MRLLMRMFLVTVLLVTGSTVLAQQSGGPLILGGDDLDDHGSRNASGVNINGWAYSESATQTIISQVTKTGTTIDIVAIGPIDPGAGNFPSDSGGMVASVASNLGLTVLYIDGQTAAQQFFSDLSNNVVNPKMIWIVSNQSSNDLDLGEEDELALHGAELNTFQQGGGGILSHSHGYEWLISLLPSVVVVPNSCSVPVVLTAAGNSAFPGITDAEVSAGPCHSSFTGNLGGLAEIATDRDGLAMIIGGAAGVTITPSAVSIPTLSIWSLIILLTLTVIILNFHVTIQRTKP